MTDRFLHLTEHPYTINGDDYRVTRIYWQRTDGTIVTTFKDSGEDGEWHLGNVVPTPTQLTAQPFPADAPRHDAEVGHGDD